MVNGDVVTSETPPTAYDSTPPTALLAHMVTGWAGRSGLPTALPEAVRFRTRREALSKRFPGDVIVVPTGNEKTRANDTPYRFRPGSDFYYLTGNLEADCVLVMEPLAAGGHDALLYVEPNLGKSVTTFFTDRVKGELWVGPRLGVPESAARFGTAARALEGVIRDLEAMCAAASGTVRTIRDLDAHIDAITPASDADGALAAAISEMRLIKDDYEIAELQAAIDATQRGFEDVLSALPQSKTERYVEGVFNLRARVDGNDVGYGTIAATGAHSCTLHYKTNDGSLNAGDLLLLDAGVETHTLYTADVTRTVPIGGTFSVAQREIYDLVLAAQNAGFARCAPGEDFLAPNRAAMRVLAEGLERLGILGVSAEEALLDTNQFYKRYSLHNVSHMLGLDVHDCAQARAETYKYGKLEAGMVLTVEPGLYFQLDDVTVPERYRGIGIRIEDDVVITPDGYRNLSGALPREASAVEAWVRECRARGYTLP